MNVIPLKPEGYGELCALVTMLADAKVPVEYVSLRRVSSPAGDEEEITISIGSTGRTPWQTEAPPAER